MSHLLLAIVLAATAAQAAVYYVSPTGNDSNNGTSTKLLPWKTLARVQQISNHRNGRGSGPCSSGCAPSRGQLTWYTSGTAAANIVIGAYGTGALTGDQCGAAPVTGWTQHSGNIYKANVAQGSVKYVFVNGALQTLARHTEYGLARVNTATSTQLTSTNITQSNGYMEWRDLGAPQYQLVLREPSRCSTDRHTISFPALTYNAGSYNWGFLPLQQVERSWMPRVSGTTMPPTGVLYLWAPTGVNPNNLHWWKPRSTITGSSSNGSATGSRSRTSLSVGKRMPG
jgi:hypothetical protein